MERRPAPVPFRRPSPPRLRRPPRRPRRQRRSSPTSNSPRSEETPGGSGSVGTASPSSSSLSRSPSDSSSCPSLRHPPPRVTCRPPHQVNIRCVLPGYGPDAKEPLPRQGSGSSTPGLFCGPSYGVEATPGELSLGMSPVCTSDMAAHGRPREFPPSVRRDTWPLALCTLMMGPSIRNARNVPERARRDLLPFRQEFISALPDCGPANAAGLRISSRRAGLGARV